MRMYKNNLNNSSSSRISSNSNCNNNRNSNISSNSNNKMAIIKKL